MLKVSNSSKSNPTFPILNWEILAILPVTSPHSFYSPQQTVLPHVLEARSPAVVGLNSLWSRFHPVRYDFYILTGSPGENRIRSTKDRGHNKGKARKNKNNATLKNRTLYMKPFFKSDFSFLVENRDKPLIYVYYLLCNDEHSNQEKGDINAAHPFWMLDQPYGPQDGCIFSAVTKGHSIYKNILKTKLTTYFLSSAVRCDIMMGFSLQHPTQNAHLLQFLSGAKIIFA